MNQINTGIVGLGWPGQRHAEAVIAADAGNLYAAADLNTERLDKFCGKFPPDKRFDSLEAMLADPELHAVVIALPNALHFPATLAALQAGKHVLCEKPPTLNAAEMKVIQEEAEKRGLIYFFGRQMRFSPKMLAARKLVRDGRLGEVYFGKAVWVRERGTPGGLGAWFTDKSRSGGGALIDIGVHAIDSAWYLMGHPRPISVTGATFQKFPQLAKGNVFDVDDSAYGFIRFEGGAVVQFEVSWAANLTDDIPESGWTKRELNNTTLYGPKATLRLQPAALFEDQAGEVVKVEIEPEGDKDQFSAQMENFFAAVHGEAKPANDAQQALYLMEMLDAIYLSSATGHEVPIAG